MSALDDLARIAHVLEFRVPIIRVVVDDKGNVLERLERGSYYVGPSDRPTHPRTGGHTDEV